MENYNKIFDDNKKWSESRKKSDPEIFKNLSKEQHPEYLFIGCSDSRVSPNMITNKDLGEMFVHRNIANLTPPGDTCTGSVLQFAIENLEVKHIIVCGHYGCGGIKAAYEGEATGPLEERLKHIRKVYEKNSKELENIENKEDLLNRLAELNVLEQCKIISENEYYKKSFEKKGFPVIHGIIYDMEKGLLKELNYHKE